MSVETGPNLQFTVEKRELNLMTSALKTPGGWNEAEKYQLFRPGRKNEEREKYSVYATICTFSIHGSMETFAGPTSFHCARENKRRDQFICRMQIVGYRMTD